MIRSAAAVRWARTPVRSLPGWTLLLSYVPVAALAVCLVGMVAIQLRWAIAFLGWPVEVMYGEAVIEDHAARLLRGEALYQPLGQPSYSVAAYTPLYYGLIAAAQALLGPSLLPGRVISAAAAVATSALLARLAAGEGRGPWAGLLAGLLFLALGFPTPFPWFALAKEDMLGVMFGVGSVAVLAGGRTSRRVVAAGLLAGLAILTKQTFIAASVAGFVALAVHDRRQVVPFAISCLGLVLVVLIGFEATTHAFLNNAVFANAQPFRLDVLLTNLATLKAYQAGVLAVAAIGVVRRLIWGRRFEDALLPIYLLVTCLPLVGLAAIGSAQNYWIELAAAAAAVAAAEIWTWLQGGDLRTRVVGMGLALAPFVNIVVAGRLALIWLPGLAQYDHPAGMRTEFAKLVERVRDADTAIIAEPIDVMAMASKPVLVEPWAADALYQSGTWDIRPLVDRVCRGEIGLAVLAHPLEDTVVGYNDYGIWPAPLIDAMRQTLVLAETRAGRYVYVYRPSDGTACPSARP